MAHDPDPVAAHHFILQTYSYYAALMRTLHASTAVDALENPSLGGKLFWAGELDSTGRALTVAGSIAGAATLAATSDANGQKLAVRDGVVDFLVNSLDEAVRILKNEVRKRETVAVGVALPMEVIEREMVERGVQPDVFREGIVRAAKWTTQNEPSESRVDPETDPMGAQALVVWRADRAPALWLPKIDAIALECLNPEEQIARRWLMRSSRYLGRMGQTGHLVRSNREFAARLAQRMQTLADQGELRVGCRIEIAFAGGTDYLNFWSPESRSTAPQA